MDATTKASRAVLAAYTKKTLKPFEIGAIIVFVLSLTGTAWLIANVSGWWWLLLILVIAYGVFGSIFWFILHFAIDKLRPHQTPPQKKAVKEFIDQLDKVSDTIGMTKFGLLLRIIRDVMQRREKNVLSNFADDSSKLKHAFEKVVDQFR